jgi:LysM repeat protein
MKNLVLFTLLVTVLSLGSCSTSRRAARTSTPSGPGPDYATEYLSKYSSLAVSEMKRTGIPASITLAQGMLESNYGRSRLATQGNNHFGIKCHSDWRGRKIYHDDNRKGECFRAYNSAEESFRDHSDFLVKGSRYRDLFSLKSTDYRAWAHGLKKAGYATDPKYPELLIRKIEEYRLWAYDTGEASPAYASQGTGRDPAAASGGRREVSPDNTGKTATLKETDTTGTVPATATDDAVRDEEPVRVVSLSTGKKTMENNNVEYIIVEEGDTYESLAERYQLLSWEITRYNDLAQGTALVPGQVLYLQPKRTKAASGLSMHTVVQGETMYSISQKYAIKLSSLYKMNLMDEGTECRPGQKLRIR